MGCPACGESLVVYELEGVEVDCCAGCAGVWLDRGELGALAQLAGSPDSALEQRLAAAQTAPAPAANSTAAQPTRRCPRCRAALEHLLLPGPLALALDRCPRGDGLWFDPGELQTLLAAPAAAPGAPESPVAHFLRAMFRYHPSAIEGGSPS